MALSVAPHELANGRAVVARYKSAFCPVGTQGGSDGGGHLVLTTWPWGPHVDRAQHLRNFCIQGRCHMGLFDAVMGNASKIDAVQIQQEFAKVLAPGEVVEHAYQLIRDYFVFTNKRLVLVDKQGLTGSKVEYHSLPYRSITHFSIETGGTLDLDAELKIWISGSATPFQKQFNKRLSIYEVQSVLASYVLK